MSIFKTITLLLLLLPIVSRAADTGPTTAIDPQRSVLTIRVFKAGVFSAFGHDHEISAPIQTGAFTKEPPSVSLTVDASKLRVMDKDVSDKDRAEIQQTMLGPKVLDAEKFPEIRFQSTGVEQFGPARWKVEGQLTIRGKTGPVKMEVREDAGHYRGSAEIRQKDFGITPVSAAGGAVKTKDELRVEFDIVGK